MNIGNKIKNLRLTHSLTQSELADRCELSVGAISLIERDLSSPSVDTLNDILDVFNVSLQDFFSTEEEECHIFKKEDVFVSEVKENNVIINWLIYNAQKNMMEPILVHVLPNGVLFDEDAHEGEEFGYVLKGKIKLEVGSNKYIVKSGESFYYNSNKNHKLYNNYTKEAIVLMVSTPPSF